MLALYIYRHRQGETGRIDRVLISFAGSFQKTFFLIGKGGRTVSDHYLMLVGTQKKNEFLEKDNAFLRTQLAALQEVEAENLRLRKGLEFQADVAQTLIAAHVVAHDISTDYHGVRIDRGSEQGVAQGMGVISPSGLVGKILRVTPHFSDVVTVLDPTSNVDIVVQRSRVRGILSGKAGELSCTLKYIDRLDDVRNDDTVVASGFGNVFPKGLLVGYVSHVTPDRNGVIKTVTVKTAVDLYRLEEVFIVVPPPEQPKTAKQS